ncbi:tetratricopeptide repeat protein [Wenyingzhuangia sp. IMCC45574]
MKKVIIVLFVILGVAANAQSPYESKMKEAFGLWGQNKSVEASQVFERIAKVETKNWLPYYYAAQTLITSGFAIKDEEVLKTRLDKAQVFLDKAKEISPKNAEILVAQATWYIVWVAYDGATYGAMYSGKVAKIYKKAFKIAPNNPRVVFGKAEWDMGTARFFGKDTSPYCKEIEKAIELFDKFEKPTPFYPMYGKERAQQVLAQCGKQK